MVYTAGNWHRIVNSALDDGTVPSDFSDAQKQMLVYDFHERGMSHAEACTRLGVSDKDGKNAVRVARYADQLVADLVRDGITSVFDVLIMVIEKAPEPIQRLAAVHVRTEKASKLQSSDVFIRYRRGRQSELGYTIAAILNDGCFLDRPKLETMLQRLQAKQNIILQGPPGTGKTWLAKRLAYALIGYKDDSKVRPFQFHPNLSYEDFVRGWRPQGDGSLTLLDGPFPQLADEARNDPDGKYVIVIEEINRGVPATIFGEMLTLLEADKRKPEEALALAYPREPGERFHIPPNVYVIGTMNVADRSLALVDLALRRRFAFFDLEPMFNVVWREWVREQSGVSAEFLIRIAQHMNAFNEQIATDPNLGKQFRIGHSYFTPAPGVPIDDQAAWFRDVVETEIAPLLQEYWFDDTQTAAAAVSQLLNVL